MLVAILGTTISPYLFFWQTNQEVEEKRNKRIKLIGLEKDISKWNKDNLAELKTLLEDMIPLIRFNLISANDFHEKIKPYKKVINECKYVNFQDYYESDR